MKKIILPEGNYYVGDLGYALEREFPKAYLNYFNIKDGLQFTDSGIQFWLCKTLNKGGTFYSQDGRDWGYDHGCFGCMLYKNIVSKNSYKMHEVEFLEPFEVSSNLDENTITIGHLHFTPYLPEGVSVKGLHIPEEFRNISNLI